MLHVQHLSKSYGVTPVLSDVSFVVNRAEHVGLIGPNGSGKSTLLRCIVGLEQPDSGSVVVDPGAGYLPQAFAEGQDRSVADILERSQVELHAAEAALQSASDALSTDTGDPRAALAAYDLALTHFETLGGYARAAQVDAVLAGLGLASVDQSTPVSLLSGGQQTRLGLAVLLLRQPDLLLLDEPTNHLDGQALEWLEAFARGYPHAVLIVSHDRAFLDATVSRILYLDSTTHSLTSYPGGYREFAAARSHELSLQEQTWRRQQESVARVQRDISRLKSEARSIEQSTTARQPGLRKFARKKAAVARCRER
jgi:ATP-binding cassette subfamily F protein 3